MVKGFIGWSVLAALTAALVITPAATASAQNKNTNRLVVPITGVAAGVGNVTGNFAISRFATQNDQLVAIGALTATVTDATGQIVRTFTTQVTMPVSRGGAAAAQSAGAISAAAIGSCDILDLVLGPLHLDLLGLVVDLNQVVLTITGTTGSGDLLGNLLCSITGLLDGASIGNQLVNLLNQLIGVLGAL